MNQRPSSIRRQQGYSSTPFRGGPILNLPEPIGPLVLLTAVISFSAPAIGGTATAPGPLFDALSFVPIRFLADLEGGNFLGALTSLVGHVFLHGSLMHLGLNMVWLMAFGSGIARRLCVEGLPQDRSRNILVFMTFYIACGIAGGLAQFAADPLSGAVVVGASGAISGLMAGTLRFALRLFVPMGAEYGPLAPLWARPVLISSAVYIGLNVAIGASQALMPGEGPLIAWEAHVGGFLFGLLAFPLFDRLAKRPPLPFGLG